jgi:hypothetical protein
MTEPGTGAGRAADYAGVGDGRDRARERPAAGAERERRVEQDQAAHALRPQAREDRGERATQRVAREQGRPAPGLGSDRVEGSGWKAVGVLGQPEAVLPLCGGEPLDEVTSSPAAGSAGRR